MKRWLVIALLFLLPLQFGWAAVERYCQHGSEPTAHQHLGHHSHHTQAEEGKGLEGQPTQPNAPDHGCAGCHCGCTVMPTNDALTMDVPASHWQWADCEPRLSAAPSKRPDRPQWPTLA